MVCEVGGSICVTLDGKLNNRRHHEKIPNEVIPKEKRRTDRLPWHKLN